jgi:hypothetical protein
MTDKKRKTDAGPPREPDRPVIIRKTFVDPDYLSGLDADARLRKLVEKAGGNPDVLDGDHTAGVLGAWARWKFDQASELKTTYRSGGSRKAGRVYEPKASIRVLCDHIGSADFDTVVNFLRDANASGIAADALADLYESTRYEMNLHQLFIDDAADDGKGRLFYVLRGDAATPENTKSISMKRLGDILRDIRKERIGS